MHAIIHIGTEKTGTTTLQKTLNDNAQALYKCGVLYLSGKDLVNARDLVAACLGDDVPDEYLAAANVETPEQRCDFQRSTFDDYAFWLQKAASECHTLVISSEHLHSRMTQVDEIKRLRDFLQPYITDFSIVCYLRRQVDMVVSLHSTVLKGGGTPNFRDQVHNMLSGNKYYCDYRQLLKNWATVFGRAAIKARLFARSRLRRGNIIDDFFHFEALPEAGLQRRAESVNESVNHLGQVLLRELNRGVKPPGSSREQHNLKIVRQTISKAFAGKGEQLPASVAVEYQSSFDEINEAVRQEYLPEEGELFSKAFSDEDGRMLSADQEEAIKCLVALVATDGQVTGTLRDYNAYADVLRDSSDLLVGEDDDKAYQLMKFANLIRPQGGLIKKKLARLEAQRNTEG